MDKGRFGAAIWGRNQHSLQPDHTIPPVGVSCGSELRDAGPSRTNATEHRFRRAECNPDGRCVHPHLRLLDQLLGLRTSTRADDPMRTLNLPPFHGLP
jgi:hypothetical protein